MSKLVNVIWVLKTKIEYDIIHVSLVLKVDNKEYKTIDEISNVLEKILKIRATRIRSIITKYIHDIEYNSEKNTHVIEYKIIINRKYKNDIDEFIEKLEESVYSIMSELNEIRYHIEEAKKTVKSEYVIDEYIYNIDL